VGYHATKRRKLQISKSEERRTLILVLVIACVPVLGAVWAITSTSQPDLSDLSPLKLQSGEYPLLGWSTLLRDHSHALNAQAAIFSGASIQALGYMMEGAQPIAAGQPTKSFVLLPDAGNLLHPAHRFGDQMIAVHLRESDPIKFSPRALVWVWGTLRTSPGDPAGDEPLYALYNAHAELAPKTDIRKYFRPE
jgi:hypothetical protein